MFPAQVIFSDEVGLQLGCSKRASWTAGARCKRVANSFAPKMTFWGAMGARKASALVHCPGRVNAAAYSVTVQKHVVPLMRQPSALFQQVSSLLLTVPSHSHAYLVHSLPSPTRPLRGIPCPLLPVQLLPVHSAAFLAHSCPSRLYLSFLCCDSGQRARTSQRIRCRPPRKAVSGESGDLAPPQS